MKDKKNTQKVTYIPKENANPFDSSKKEPVYVNEGEEFGTPIGQSKRPKWMIANTPFQKKLLSAVGRTYYQNHNERSAVVAIEKSAISLTGGLISVYPLEWVDQCIDWAKKKRRDGMLVGFLGLVNLINDSDKKQQFISKWQHENPEISLRKNIEESSIQEEEKPNYNLRG